MQLKHPLILLVCALACFAGSAMGYNNPPLAWKTIKTEHFEVHYHEGAEWTARKVAEVAEEVHGPLTDLYQYEPKVPVHFIIKDTHDYANGAAYFFDNKVEIWATNLEFGFRGTTDWIRNVVTHEYTHIISIQAATKMPTRVPAIYFQVLSFEKEKRPDVLQGYPQHIVSYPFSGIVMPPWFAEGVAQYQSPSKQYDCWDTHRDMILRCAVLENEMLSYPQMGFFGGTGLQNEQVYDHGYGLVSYIASTYGDEALRTTTEALKSFRRLSVDGALKKATGKSGKQLYEEWKAYLSERYSDQLSTIEPSRREGAALSTDGYMTVSPTYSPDGGRIAFLSNEGNDYSGTSIFVIDTDGKNKKAIKGGVHSSPRFSADGKTLVYSKKVKIDKYGSRVNDLFLYDFDKEKERRLTKGARAADPDFSPDGRRIACVYNRDGNHRLVVMDVDGTNAREVFAGRDGTQIYNPQFSMDGSEILFGIFEGVTRDLAAISTDGTGFRYVLRTMNDERDARWTRDGRNIVFASDRNGVFNIYQLDVESEQVSQLTNVVGGAFTPDLSPDGSRLAYARYDASGYGIFQLEDPTSPVETLDLIAYGQRSAGRFDECVRLRTEAVERTSPRAPELAMAGKDPLPPTTPSDARPGEEALQSEGYSSAYTPFQIFPRVLVWDGRPRFGLFSVSNEILDKQSLFFGGSYGTDGKFDALLSYEIRNFFPTVFAEGILLREKTSDQSIDDDPLSPSFGHTFIFDEIRYDLWAVDLGLKFELGESFSLTNQHELALYWSHGEYRIDLEGREFREDGSFLTSFGGGWKYYQGDQANLRYTYRKLPATTDMDINPRGGRQIRFHYFHSMDDLAVTGEFEKPADAVLTPFHYNQFTLDWREYVALPWWRHSLRLRLMGSVIDDDVDDFFWVFMGGRDGIRGYTYYTIGGRKGVLGSVTYRFPIWRRIDRQLLHLYFRDIYGSVFYESANAWDESGFKTTDYKKSAGYELRLSLGSYYIFPTAVSWVSAYAFDTVRSKQSAGGGLDFIVTQERGWSHYFTLTFGFDL